MSDNRGDLGKKSIPSQKKKILFILEILQLFYYCNYIKYCISIISDELCYQN